MLHIDIKDPIIIDKVNKEREYVENLFYSKFNFFILFFTLFLGLEITVINAEYSPCYFDKWQILLLLMAISLFISTGISYTLIRSRKILEEVLKIRDKNDELAKELKKKIGRGYTNLIIGVVIPILCTVILAAIPLSYILLRFL